MIRAKFVASLSLCAIRMAVGGDGEGGPRNRRIGPPRSRYPCKAHTQANFAAAAAAARHLAALFVGFSAHLSPRRGRGKTLDAFWGHLKRIVRDPFKGLARGPEASSSWLLLQWRRRPRRRQPTQP